MTDTKIAARVELIEFGPCGPTCTDPLHDDNNVVPPGTQGTVDFIDDAGTVHVNWDNGRRIGLLPNIDKWKEMG